MRNGRSHNQHLQHAFDKYGEQAFVFSVLEYCDVEKLNEREEAWIQSLNSCVSGYNLNIGGGGLRGFHMSEETKQKIRTANTGRIVSEEAKRRMSENHADFSGEKNPNYGTRWADRHTPEQIEAIKKENVRIKTRREQP